MGWIENAFLFCSKTQDAELTPFPQNLHKRTLYNLQSPSHQLFVAHEYCAHVGYTHEYTKRFHAQSHHKYLRSR